MAAIAAVVGGLEANFKFQRAIRRIAELFQKCVHIVGVQSTDPAEMKTFLFAKTGESFPVKVEIVGGSVRRYHPYRLRLEVSKVHRLGITRAAGRIMVGGMSA